MVRDTIERVKLFHENHTYISQYGLIIIASAFIFYTPNLLNLIGLQSIQPSEYFKSEIKTPIDAIYFSIVSITTLGFGDITPQSQIMRAVVSIEVLLGIITIGQALNAITVKAEEKKRLPHRLAAYEDVRLLSHRLASYWQNIYIQSVPDALPDTLDKLLSQESLTKMSRCLDLDAKPNVTPPRTWWEWLPQQLADMKTLAEKILERHIQVLDPVAYSYIHSILSDSMLAPGKVNSINAIKQSDQAMGFPRPTNLGSYLVDNEESLNPILELNKWCKKEYELLQSTDVISIKKPFEILEIQTPTTTPKSCMSQEKLRLQLAKQAEFRARSKA